MLILILPLAFWSVFTISFHTTSKSCDPNLETDQDLETLQVGIFPCYQIEKKILPWFFRDFLGSLWIFALFSTNPQNKQY